MAAKTKKETAAVAETKETAKKAQTAGMLYLSCSNILGS